MEPQLAVLRYVSASPGCSSLHSMLILYFYMGFLYKVHSGHRKYSFLMLWIWLIKKLICLGFRELEPFKIISFSLLFLYFLFSIPSSPFQSKPIGGENVSRRQLGELDLNTWKCNFCFGYWDAVIIFLLVLLMTAKTLSIRVLLQEPQK